MKEKNTYTMNPLARMAYELMLFLSRLPKLLYGGLKAAGRAVKNGFKAIGRGLKRFVQTFIKGDAFTKLSYVVMGFGCAARGQVIKGLLFLGAQLGLGYVIFGFGLNYLKDLGTLGVNAETSYIDEATGLIKYKVADNSMLILLYSVMTLLIIGVFIALYIASINASYKAQLNHEKGVKQPSFIDDVRALFNEKYHAALLSLPTVMAVTFVVLPMVFMVLIAFTNYDQAHQPPGNLFTWVGLQNFKDVFGENSFKTHSFKYLLRWTVIWAFFATTLNYILGTLLAVAINKKGIRFKKLWRTVFVISIAVPQFVSLLVMRNIFGDMGTVNRIVEALGGTAVKFLSNGQNARLMVILINLWVGIPYSMLITSGILMNIPADLYESARIDGAGPVRTFVSITMPYMLFVTTPYLITQFVGNFNSFNVIYLLTMGNPASLSLYQAGETDLLVTWLYKLTVNYQDYNLASVIGIFVFIVSAAMSLIVYNVSSSAKKEEEFQ